MVLEAKGGGRPENVEAHFFRVFINGNVTDENLRQSILNMEKGKRVIITQVLKYPGSARLTPKSKVISNVAAFEYDVEAMNEFVRPATVTVAEARGSAKKRRLSVEGDVVEVGGCVTTTEYSRRSLQIEGAGSKIEVVLWGEAAVRDYAISKKIVITALVKEERRLSSTPSTSIEMSVLTEVEGEIIGIGDTENGYPIELILESGESLFVGEGVAFDYEVVLPLRVTYRATASGIVQSIAVMPVVAEEAEV
eukprot:XP_011679644.1 PREDICTED: uncharacterized protein LOC105445601 [Strongylocentrotus purpuratus]